MPENQRNPEAGPARFFAAVVQLCSTADVEANWRSAEELIRRAAGYGARFVATPENTNFLGLAEEKVKLVESASVAPGDVPVVVSTPLGRFGLTVCYDVRFPELYRRLCGKVIG